MEDRIGSREHALGAHLTSRRAKQREEFGPAATHILMRQVARIALQVPVLSGLGNGLIGSSFILTPHLHPSQFGNTITESNQTLFFLCLPIMNRDNPRFAHPQGGAGPTPGPPPPEAEACLMQAPPNAASPVT